MLSCPFVICSVVIGQIIPGIEREIESGERKRAIRPDITIKKKSELMVLFNYKPCGAKIVFQNNKIRAVRHRNI